MHLRRVCCVCCVCCVLLGADSICGKPVAYWCCFCQHFLVLNVVQYVANLNLKSAGMRTMVATQILNKQERNASIWAPNGGIPWSTWPLGSPGWSLGSLGSPGYIHSCIHHRSVSSNCDCYANSLSVLLYFNFIGQRTRSWPYKVFFLTDPWDVS